MDLAASTTSLDSTAGRLETAKRLITDLNRNCKKWSLRRSCGQSHIAFSHMRSILIPSSYITTLQTHLRRTRDVSVFIMRIHLETVELSLSSMEFSTLGVEVRSLF